MPSAIKTTGLVLITIVLFPFAMVVAFPILAWHLPQWLWYNYKWKSLLVQQGRFRNPQIAVAELRSGTLIVDSPTLGWGLLRCWWTPDELRTITPHAIPSDNDRQQHIEAEPERLELPFDRWVHSQYLDSDTGSAILLATRRGNQFAARCTKLNPALDIVNTWSGSVLWYNQHQNDV